MQNFFNWLKQNAETIFKWALLLILIYIPLFADLDTLPLRIWDEARQAESAYEMNKYGNYLVPHIMGMPDMWSVKPPLFIWLEVLCIKLLGAGELAVRLPSAIAGLGTCLLLIFFCTRYFKNFWWAFAAAMVLVTSQGYISMHAERSADYDSLLTFFITFYSLSFYAYTVSQKSKYITFTAIGLILACLTKGIAGLFFLPALFIFALYKGLVPGLLKNKLIYLYMALFFITVSGFYLLREHYNPGYVAAVIENEWGGRYFDVKEGHSDNFWFYHMNFLGGRFAYWYLFVPFGIIIGRASKNALIKDFMLYLTLLLVVYFIIISAGKTKTIQYDVPMYPFMALVIGVLLPFLIDIVEKFQDFTSLRTPYFKYAVILLVFQAPYRAIIYDTYKPYERPQDEEFYQTESYLQNAIKGNRNLNNYYVYANGYSIQDLFYINILGDKGEKLQLTDKLNLNQGDKIIVNDKKAQKMMKDKYNCTAIDSLGSLKVYLVNAIKNE